MADLAFTGERFLPACTGEIAYEHWHRYAFARRFVAGKRVLDAACGEGYGSALLGEAAASVVGVDIDAAMLARARARIGAGVAAGAADADLVAGAARTLEQHARVEARFGERRHHADHGAADDVGGRALQPRVDGRALVEGADRGVRGLDVGVMAFPAKQSLDIAMLAAEIARLVHIGADAGEALEIFLDVGGGFLAGDAELVGKPERRDAVDDAEIDRLGAAADFARHAFHRHAEHLRRIGFDVSTFESGEADGEFNGGTGGAIFSANGTPVF